jgi:hypothetical protein
MQQMSLKSIPFATKLKHRADMVPLPTNKYAANDAALDLQNPL